MHPYPNSKKIHPVVFLYMDPDQARALDDESLELKKIRTTLDVLLMPPSSIHLPNSRMTRFTYVLAL